MNVLLAISKFDIKEEIVDYIHLGNGHINESDVADFLNGTHSRMVYIQKTLSK